MTNSIALYNSQRWNASVTGRKLILLLVTAILLLVSASLAYSENYNEPWRDRTKGLVLDAYELNSLDWNQIVKNPRIVGFIGKASDGLSAEYCSDRSTLCGAKWRKYSVTKELYHTRKMLAKALGLKWGAYHLGRAGNPEQQALHFLQFTKPEKDEAIVLDIESMDSSKFMSLKDAERFARYVYKKLDRYPMLYTNHNTAAFIAANRKDYPLLSRMQLWYARYKSDVTGVFPLGNWDDPAIWQFAYGGNCSKKPCPYRVKGTPRDIDVNVSMKSIADLRKAWPFNGLVDEKPFSDEPDPNIIMVSNTVEYPEEEKHSKFVMDQDYSEPEISDLSVAGIKKPVTEEQIAMCNSKIDELESDALANC